MCRGDRVRPADFQLQVSSHPGLLASAPKVTLPCGKALNPGNPFGRLLGARVALAGTSNAR